jgi:uncharacterized protein YggE
MRTKLLLITSVLVLGLILSACGTIAAQPRSLSVSGSGMVSLTPDIAYVNIGVHTDNPDLATAVNQNNTQTQTLVDSLKNAGISGEDIQTSNFSVYSNGSKSFDPSTGQEIDANRYYSVDNTVYVTIRDLSKLGTLLSTGIASGANNINGITFDVADKTAAMAEARQKAMTNAKNLALELAAGAGVKLGAIQTISYSDINPVPYYGMGGGGASAPNASVPIQPGQTQISVTVNVTYEVK